jgi:hypothetical protein
VLALLLRDANNLQVTVYERDESADKREQGYAIGINPDGLAILSQLYSTVPGALWFLLTSFSLSLFFFCLLFSPLA